MKIFKNTVSEILWEILNELMHFEELSSFRLVGGTSLSLQLGHRMSVDIDLFTDAEYGTIDFNVIDKLFLNSFPYVEMGYGGNNSFGKSYYLGNSKNELVKVDLFYTDTFVFPNIKHNEIRLARLEEISAMKLEVIANNGRKKDFWDIHKLMEIYSLEEMLNFYEKRYPYNHTRNEIIEKLADFDEAENDFNPICLKGKYWEIIKLDFEEVIERYMR